MVAVGTESCGRILFYDKAYFISVSLLAWYMSVNVS